MHQFRVTKYDPAYRDHRGAFMRNEWISYGDIGRIFDYLIFTEVEYHRVEDAYASVAIAFLRESAVTHLSVMGLENRAGLSPPFGEVFAPEFERSRACHPPIAAGRVLVSLGE